MKKNVKNGWNSEECIKNKLTDDGTCCWNVSIIKPFKKSFSESNSFLPKVFFNFLN